MFDLSALSAALAAHGRVARVVIAGIEGSSPREVGAAMLVWSDGQSGTIGGGALEHQAAVKARAWLAATSNFPPEEGPGLGPHRVDRVALGPSLGQCCGGAVTLWTELYDVLPDAVAGVVARGPGAMPLAVSRVLAAARGQGMRPAAGLVAGWLLEPVARPERQVWVWGAGHVGRALVSVLAPLPGIAVTWVDVSSDRFPAVVPEGVTAVPAADPAVLADHAPLEAEHLILTYSHALDLELCHRLLDRGFGSCGLIGSATKWARFRSRLTALGHRAEAVGRIRCPIGNPALGKHPQAIAVGVAADLLTASMVAARERRA
jgi:xanthine dehydrogenase accessory factor